MSTPSFNRAYLKALKVFAKEARHVSGGKIKSHLKVATKSHARQAAKRELLKHGKTVKLSELAKFYDREKEPETSSVVDELVLYMDNDEPSYRQMEAIKKNYARKLRNGTYNHDLAPKGWRAATDSSSERYTKEIGKEGILHHVRGQGKQAFSVPVREEAANYLAWRFINWAQSGEFDHDL